MEPGVARPVIRVPLAPGKRIYVGEVEGAILREQLGLERYEASGEPLTLQFDEAAITVTTLFLRGLLGPFAAASPYKLRQQYELQGSYSEALWEDFCKEAYYARFQDTRMREHVNDALALAQHLPHGYDKIAFAAGILTQRRGISPTLAIEAVENPES